MTRARRWLPLAAAAATLHGCPPSSQTMNDGPVTLPDVPVICEPIVVTPSASPYVVATGSITTFHASGGAGSVMFTLDGTTADSTIAPGGALTAGAQAAIFDVVASDPRCAGSSARVTVSVRGPFDVQPRATWVQTNGSVQFTASQAVSDVLLQLVAHPSSDTRDPSSVVTGTTFHAGGSTGVYQLAATDTGSGREVPLAVTVCDGTNCPQLAPIAPVLAVPGDGTLRIDWTGGSGNVTGTVAPTTAGTVSPGANGALVFTPAAMFRGSAQVNATDSLTTQTSSVQVLVGDTLATAPVARGSESYTGDLGIGDVNGDHVADLVVGHTERGHAGFEAGGLLVYFGRAGGYGERTDGQPDQVIDGAQPGQRFGEHLVVRDVNNDGIDDVTTASPEGDVAGVSRGTASILLGSPMGLATPAERVLIGEDLWNEFGSALLVDDVTGDHAPDVILGAPGASNPFDDSCKGGRVYVYRNRDQPTIAGVTDPVPMQTIDIELAIAGGSTQPACASQGIGAGRSLALIDMDGDGQRDLVVGVVPHSWEVTEWSPSPGFAGAALIYRGIQSDTAAFETTPAWEIVLDMNQSDTQFAYGLDVVSQHANGPQALVLRTPFFDGPGSDQQDAGAFWVFDANRIGMPGGLPMPAPIAQGTRPITFVNLSSARASYVGTEPPWGSCRGGGIGRSATVADVDGDGNNEYVVGSTGGRIKALDLFATSGAAPSGTLTPLGWDIPVVPRTVDSNGHCMDACAGTDGRCDSEGFDVLGAPGGMSHDGLVRWLAWRNETRGTSPAPFVGTLEYLPASATALTTAWQPTTLDALPLPSFTSTDQAGTTVAIADLTPSAGLETLVGAPGAHAPPTGQELLTGTVDVVNEGATSADDASHLWQPATRWAAMGGASVVTLDFDGQPGLEVAVGIPIASTGGSDAPTSCQALDESGNLDSQYGQWSRGEVRVFAYSNGAWVAKYSFVPIGDQAASGAVRGMNPGMPRFWHNDFGAALAVADVNGDGKQDLVVGRSENGDSVGTDVILGRALPSDDMVFTTDSNGNRVPSPIVACDSILSLVPAPMNASDWSYPVYPGRAVAGLGPLGGSTDHCDEVAMSLTAGAANNTGYRAGLVVGFDLGAGCSNPAYLTIVPDQSAFANNDAADPTSFEDDTEEQWDTQSGFGSFLSAGRGNLVDDAAPDLVFRDRIYAPGASGSPSVEVVSGGCLARALSEMRSGSSVDVCAQGAQCTWTDHASYFAIGANGLSSRCRTVLSLAGVSQRFGEALTIADVTGGPTAELAIGVPDDSVMGGFAGSVRVFRDGNLTAPWLVAVGDIGENGAFGSSVAFARSTYGWLVAGAPQSTRHGVGVSVGMAGRWQLP